MRILHCCLANFYADGFAYQENVLSRLHKQQGHIVMILASTETYLSNKKLGYVPSASYISSEGIPIRRLPYVYWLPKKWQRKLRVYSGVQKSLEEFAPDVIFMHNCQTSAVFTIVKYLRKHQNVRLYVDSHTDQFNSAKNWLSKYVLHKIIYRCYTKQLIPYMRKFYATLPVRGKFAMDIYKVPASLISFLPFGADTSHIDFSHRMDIRSEMRKRLKISTSDVVLIAGGKIVERKNIHLLLEAVNKLANEHLKLILFGSIGLEMKELIESLLAQNPNVIYVGWLPACQTYQYFFAADLTVFPGTHSSLWEESIGLGMPGIFKKWEGIDHVDLGGNSILLDVVTVKTLTETISLILDDRDLLEQMTIKARLGKNMNKFNYEDIAKRAIEC